MVMTDAGGLHGGPVKHEGRTCPTYAACDCASRSQGLHSTVFLALHFMQFGPGMSSVVAKARLVPTQATHDSQPPFPVRSIQFVCLATSGHHQVTGAVTNS